MELLTIWVDFSSNFYKKVFDSNSHLQIVCKTWLKFSNHHNLCFQILHSKHEINMRWGIDNRALTLNLICPRLGKLFIGVVKMLLEFLIESSSNIKIAY